MLLLAVDTSTSNGSVAILENNKILGEISINSKITHSERVLTSIDYLLNFLNLELKNFDIFISGIGPGSFTGIRIGLSLLKGFSKALNKPLIGVPSIDALAMEYKGDGDFIAFIEGRADEIFYAQFKRINNKIERVSEYFCSTKDILPSFPQKIGIANSLEAKDSFIEGNLFAHNFGILGFNLFKNKDYSVNVTPLYLKKSDAEINLLKR